MAKKSKVEKADLKKKSASHEGEVQIEDEVGDETPEKESSSKSKKSRGENGGSVYKVIEVIGSSQKSWEHAAQIAVERASQTLENLRIAEVVDQDLKIEDGTITAYRTKLRLSFKFRE